MVSRLPHTGYQMGYSFTNCFALENGVLGHTHKKDHKKLLTLVQDTGLH
jgi:hypothetical protein